MTSKQVVTDDYERWYTEQVSNNRMVLSLKSGIHHEVNWALDRLCRLCDNERFHLQELPGLIEALFEWPRWLLHDGLAAQTPAHALFSSPAEHEKKTRHALLSILVLRSASLNLPNATALAASPRTRPLILAALQRLDPAHDTHAEFLLYTVELFLAILPVAPGTALAFPPGQNPIPILADLAHSSSNRSLAIAALSTLSLIFAEPQNAVHLRSTTSALDSAVRFLPAFTLGDKELSEACVSYLYTHLSNSHMAKAFLLHPDMASTLRLLIMLLVAEQEEETNMIALGPAPVLGPPPRFRMLSALELEELGPMPEPDRSLHWMRVMFVARPDGEMSQVEFWTLYKDTFAGYSDQSLMLAAPELIKGISNVFPTAHAVCLEGPVPRWIMRGVARRVEDRALCQWERGRCAAAPPERRAELVEHVRQHIVERVEDALPCLWGACTHPPLPKAALWPHVVTHLQGALPPSVAALPAETVLVSAHAAAPAAPAAPAVAVTLAKNEPPQLSLTALLCVRLLFHLSFSAAGAAPRVDAEHFGFPGVVEEDEAGDVAAVSILGEEEGERRGRHAFVGVRHLMERVRIKDDALMGWMTEMVEVSTYTEAV